VTHFYVFFFLFITVNKLTKLWKAIHKGPVMRIALLDNVLMASGRSDGSDNEIYNIIRVYIILKEYRE